MMNTLGIEVEVTMVNTGGMACKCHSEITCQLNSKLIHEMMSL